jgi:sulfite reductase (ferredoxin)
MSTSHFKNGKVAKNGKIATNGKVNTNGKVAKPSAVETAKQGSRQLRGGLTETLQDKEAPKFGKDDVQVLKFHGIYQQDDRDNRIRGQDRQHSFMIRAALPMGALTGDQYLALDAIADRYANGTLRVTTRQAIQYHGVIKGDLKTTIAALNQELVTTLAACGDVMRNVMACPAPVCDHNHEAVKKVAHDIAVALRPSTKAYHEIWLEGEKVVTTKEEEPFYGATYLPRKFKVAVAASHDNCVDVFTQDVGLVAIVKDGDVEGFNLIVGGGQGMTNRRPDTFAALGQPMGFVSVENGIRAVKSVAAVFRDHGNRSDRKHARLKYLIDEWGWDKFRKVFEEEYGEALEEARPATLEYHDHLGAHQQGDGRWFYGVWIENGRIADRDSGLVRTALRTIVEQLKPDVRLTPHQNLLLTNLTEAGLARVKQILAQHNVTPVEELSGSRRRSMACPALPTCGLALAEAERYIPNLLSELEPLLKTLNLWDTPMSVRMTGCPNGCARPYTADLSFVGRSKDMYQVYVGGRSRGDRLGDLYAADVTSDEIVSTVKPLLELYSTERLSDEESLGDFYRRVRGETYLRKKLTGKEEPTKDSMFSLRGAS